MTPTNVEQNSVATEPASEELFPHPFRNEPFLDGRNPEVRQAYAAALERVRGELGREYPNIIGGVATRAAEQFASHNPSRFAEIVGLHQENSAAVARDAVAAAQTAWPQWSQTPVRARVQILLRAAELLRRRKLEFCAWMALETGKIFPEADADAGEAIDFLEYYARQAWRLQGHSHPMPAFQEEHDELRYLPLGVGVVLPPWNFPLAILTGMTSAAIVTGNTVVVKPSSDAPTIAAKLMEVLAEAGLPAGVVNFITGGGELVGGTLVEDERVRFISFTGSKRVGLQVNQRAAQPRPGQPWIKRTVLEMGGKDAIVVDADVDLAAAVEAVAVSAFGFQGQKCSACSRVIVHQAIHDRFVQALSHRVQQMTLGAADAEGTVVGPVINQRAVDRCREAIIAAQAAGAHLALGGTVDDRQGFFVEPTIFTGVAPDSPLAQEELFAPILAVLRCRDFADGLRLANQSEYGLTGAVFTRDEAKLRQAADSFFVGNLYLNRKCTGAMVGSHPFGGFNMSGTDSKAGGPDYLLLFTQAKSIAARPLSTNQANSRGL